MHSMTKLAIACITAVALAVGSFYLAKALGAHDPVATAAVAAIIATAAVAAAVTVAVTASEFNLKYSWVLGMLGVMSACIYGALKVHGIAGLALAAGGIALLAAVGALGKTRAARSEVNATATSDPSHIT